MDHDAFWHGTAPLLLWHLPKPIPIDTLVVDRFTESWAHPTQCPIVRAVYKIALTQHSLDAYFGYRSVFYAPLWVHGAYG